MKIEAFDGNEYTIPLIPQYGDIPYAEGLCCPYGHTHKGYGHWYDEMVEDKIVGYIADSLGEFEVVKECKHCGQKYRFHMYKNYTENFQYDKEYWMVNVAQHLSDYNHDYLKNDKQ